LSSGVNRIRDALRGSAALPAIIGVAWLVLLAGQQGAHFGKAFDPTVLIVAGTDFAPEPLLPAGAHVFEGTGFDGQFFFYLAQDPLALQADTRARLDNTRYRARRVLLPALAYAASGGGDRDVLPWVLVLINLVATGAATFILAGWLRRRGTTPWLALAYPLSFGVVSGVVSDVADPLAAAFLTIGLLAWTDNRTGTALVALTAAALAREIYLLPGLAVVVIEIVRFRHRALPWLAVPAVVAGWFAYTSTIPTAGPDEIEPESPSPVPFVGAISKIARLDDRNIPGTANWELLYITVLVVIAVYVAVVAARTSIEMLRSRRWMSREELLLVPAAGALAVVPFLTVALWRNPLSYGRYGAFATVVLLALLIRGHRLGGGLLAVLVALSLLNPYASPLPTRFGPVITGPGVSSAAGPNP